MHYFSVSILQLTSPLSLYEDKNYFMRLDEDYLRELELWSMFALQRAQPVHDAESGALNTTEEHSSRSKMSPRMATRANLEASVESSVASANAPEPTLAAPKAISKHAPTSATMPVDPARAARIAALDWAGLEAEAAGCHACGLCKQRKQAVFGVGAQNAPWLLIGDAPAEEEDSQGEPFVGQAGKLLDAMLTATGLQRGREVYIAYAVKCRPPGNRTPSTDEVAACAPLLDRQIELIKPALILALGKTAMVRLVPEQAATSMASLRGQLHDYPLQGRNLPVVATYHPLFLLRNPSDKLKAWEDLVLAKRTLENSEAA